MGRVTRGKRRIPALVPCAAALALAAGPAFGAASGAQTGAPDAPASVPARDPALVELLSFLEGNAKSSECYERVIGAIWTPSDAWTAADLLEVEAHYVAAVGDRLGGVDLRPLFDARISGAALREGRFDLALERTAAFEARAPEPDVNTGVFDFCARVSSCRVLYTRLRVWLKLGLTDRARAYLGRLEEAYASLAEPQDSDTHELCLARFDVALAEADFLGAVEAADEGLVLFPDVETGDPREDDELRLRREDLILRRLAARAKLALVHTAQGPAVFADAEDLADEATDAASEAEVLFRAYSMASLLGWGDEQRELGAAFPAQPAQPLDRAVACAMRADASPDDRDAARELSAALDVLLAFFAERPPRASGSGWFFSDRARFVVRVAAESAATPEEGLDVVLRALSLNDVGRSMGLSDVRAADLRAALTGPNDATLVLWPGDVATALFLVTDAGIERHRAAGAESMREHVSALSALLWPFSLDDEGWEDTWRTHAKGLAGGLLGPGVEERLASLDRLTVVGGELLWNAPLGLLLVEGEPLALRTAVRELADPRVGLVAKRTALDPDRVVFTAGVPAAGWTDPLGGASAAPTFAPGTVDQIQSALGAALLADRAAEEDLLGGSLDGAAAWVFLGHGDHRIQAERTGALVVGSRSSTAEPGDGRLDCSEVEGLDAPDLAFLAACSAGAGPRRMGSGAAAHLAGAFTRAGSDCIVASRVDLLVGSTALFLERFAEAFRDGATVGEAVRTARLEVRATPGFEHPVHWMGLDVFGDDSLRLEMAQRADESRRASRLGWIFVGAALGALVAVVVRRRGRRAASA